MSAQEDLFGTGLQRPEEDDFLLDVVERFGGDVVAIGPLQQDPKVTWVEVIRPLAERRRWSKAVHAGRPQTVRLEEVILLGRFSSYEKPQRKGSAKPWQVQWEDGTPMGIGLFTTKEFADAYRSRR